MISLFKIDFLNNIVATAKKYGFRDIHFDFEFLRPADREAYNRFLTKSKGTDLSKKAGSFQLPLLQKQVRPKKENGMRPMIIGRTAKLSTSSSL